MPNLLSDSRVIIVKDKPCYCQEAPYHPSENYSEWAGFPTGSSDNPSYRAVRKLFYFWGLDSKRYGTKEWNPLSELVAPGNTVVIKPNLVNHYNTGEKCYNISDTDSLVTHGSVIRAVLDYVAKALNGYGKIIVGDCPIQGCNWDQVIQLVGLDSIEEHFRQYFPEIILVVKDYRLGKAIVKNGVTVKRVVDQDSFKNYEEIDLKQYSALVPLMSDPYSFGVAQYPKYRMCSVHSPGVNKYLIPKDFIYADVVINLPKMKSHMKAGITCALKNFVGINGHKDYLPHFRFGSPKNGGDEYPDGNWLWDLMWFFTHLEWSLDKGLLKRLLLFMAGICNYLLPVFSEMPREASSIGGGGWHGNDTLWRTILDINRVFFYFDRQKKHISTNLYGALKYIAIADGLVAGHKEAPLAPTPLSSGIMMGAFNPLAMDTAAAAMMGFDYCKVKQVIRGYSLESLPLADFDCKEIELYGNTGLKTVEDIYQQKAYTSFEPSRGFRGFIEFP